MRHLLTFKTNLPESTDYEHPKGHSICKLLAEELAEKGIEVQPLDNYWDIAWSVDCQINNKRIFFFVGYLGTKQTDWQLIVCSNSGLLKRLLGHKDINERIDLAKAIHDILSGDKQFSDLKWFSRYTDKSSDECHSTPLAFWTLLAERRHCIMKLRTATCATSKLGVQEDDFATGRTQ